MATLRDTPYEACKFLVNLGAGADEGSVVAGFAEVRGLSGEIGVIEYRNGNERVGTVRKVPGLTRYEDVTLTRGVIGSLDLFEWFKSVSNGKHDVRTVTITLLDEAREPVMVFKLRNAWPKKWSGPDLNAKANEVAIEELVLTHEGLDVE